MGFAYIYPTKSAYIEDSQPLHIFICSFPAVLRSVVPLLFVVRASTHCVLPRKQVFLNDNDQVFVAACRALLEAPDYSSVAIQRFRTTAVSLHA